MKSKKVVVTAGDMATPYGWGIEVCWEGLLAERCALRPIKHFGASAFQGSAAGLVEGLNAQAEGSRVMAMLAPLLEKARGEIPQDTLCLLATTIGEIEYLERAVLENTGGGGESCPSRLLSKIEKAAGLQGPGLVVSAACSSSGAAVAEAANMIAGGERDSVLVVACDGVSEFLYAGFSSLLALDPKNARPFDQDREGLSVGEAAVYLLLMSETRALEEGRKVLGEVAGWGLSNDANHMTGPSRDGEGLARAIAQSLAMAGTGKEVVTSISAHGTGTPYNDAMEMKAFKTVFGESAIPTYSIKGGMGHTMAAAGAVEVLMVLKTLEEQKVPATLGVCRVDEEAQGWISGQSRKIRGDYALSTNSGFGGINTALLLKRGRP